MTSAHSKEWCVCGVCVCVCVCVCSFPPILWQSHGSRRDVYFTLQCIQGTTPCSVFFCPFEPTRVTQEGVNTGAFLFFLFFFNAHPLLQRLPPFLSREERVQPSIFLVDNEVEFCTDVFCRVRVPPVGHRGCHRTHRNFLYCTRVFRTSKKYYVL